MRRRRYIANGRVDKERKPGLVNEHQKTHINERVPPLMNTQYAFNMNYIRI